MSKKYSVSIGDIVVIWENGKFKSENKDVERLIDREEQLSKNKPVFMVKLDGSLLYSGEWRKPSQNWALSFGFLQDITGGDLKFIEGDRPTWEKLGWKDEEGAVY